MKPTCSVYDNDAYRRGSVYGLYARLPGEGLLTGSAFELSLMSGSALRDFFSGYLEFSCGLLLIQDRHLPRI
jgi:hypothetical protein